MKKAVLAVILGLSLLACPILYFAVGPKLDAVQIDVLKILLIICGCSAAYCFLVGELSKNNSQMDKLWSILPEVYVWIVAIRGGLHPRLVVMAVLATLWGARLTFNFARKGAYKLRFWEGEEDYRWQVLRGKKEFQPHWKWLLFNLFFISIYQNALILCTTFPALISMNATAPFGWVDGIAAALLIGFLTLETVADAQQWRFHSKKKALLRDGTPLKELPAPYNKGFNTLGLWARSRHPNYLGEQGIWASFYVFSIGAGVGVINWSVIGALLLVALFAGSSMFGEEISASKYPEYAAYQKRVSKFIPWKKYEA
jgi:steroid 5-alpha reductase family enzyme